MQQIYLGWDIMDEYHNIIDHYQGYYYLHSLFQNTAQVKTFQSENSSCFEFSNPAKKGRLENPSGKKKSKRNICKTWIFGGRYSLLRHIFEIRFGNTKNKMWEALAFQRGEEKVWKGVGNIKRYWKIQKNIGRYWSCWTRTLLGGWRSQSQLWSWLPSRKFGENNFEGNSIVDEVDLHGFKHPTGSSTQKWRRPNPQFAFALHVGARESLFVVCSRLDIANQEPRQTNKQTRHIFKSTITKYLSKLVMG